MQHAKMQPNKLCYNLAQSANLIITVTGYTYSTVQNHDFCVIGLAQCEI